MLCKILGFPTGAGPHTKLIDVDKMLVSSFSHGFQDNFLSLAVYASPGQMVLPDLVMNT